MPTDALQTANRPEPILCLHPDGRRPCSGLRKQQEWHTGCTERAGYRECKFRFHRNLLELKKLEEVTARQAGSGVKGR